MDDRSVSCLFTGHRALPEERAEVEKLQKLTAQAIRDAYAAGFRTFYAGGAIGFDMLAAVETVNARMLDLHDVKLILALPHFGHYQRWKSADKAVFSQILKRADGIVYIEQNYMPGCMQKRNRYMVERCARCICYCTKSTGGTAYTVTEAKKAGLTIVNLAQSAQISIFDEKNA